MKHRNILLTLFFFITTVTGISFYFYEIYEEKIDYEYLTKSIQNNLTNRLQNIVDEQIKLEYEFKKQENLSAFLKDYNSKNSIYVYEDEKSIFWNDFTFYPSSSLVNASKINAIVFSSFENGEQILVLRNFRTKNHVYKLVSVLKLATNTIKENSNLVQLNYELFGKNALEVLTVKHSKYRLVNLDGKLLFGINYLKPETLKQNYIYVLFIFLGFIFAGIALITFKQKQFSESINRYVALLFISAVVSYSFYFLVFSIQNSSIPIIYNFCFYFISGICLIIFWKIFLAGRLKIEFDFKNKYLLILFFYVVFLSITYVFFKSIAFLYNNFDYDFSVFNLLSFTNVTYFSFVITICLSIFYFYITHVVFVKLIQLYIKSQSKIDFIILISMLFFVSFLLTIGTGTGWIFVSFSSCVYFLIILFSKLPLTLQKIRYITYFYLFTYILFLSIIISCSIFKVEFAKRATVSKKLAFMVSRNQPSLDVKFISSGMDSILTDSLTKKILADTIESRSDLETELIRKNFADVSKRYETKFYFFNQNGNSISGQSSKNFFSIQKKLNKPNLYTKFRCVYKFDGDLPGYFAWRLIKDSSQNEIGYVLVEFRLRKLIPNSIYTELFKNIKLEDEYNYSYALYVKNNLTSVYNQKTNTVSFPILDKEIIKNYSAGKIENGRYLRLSQTNENEYVMIGLDAFGFLSFYSNFSFIFIVFTFILSLFILFNTFYYKYKQVSNTLSTKIQLFIHLSFFIPLLSVSVSLFVIINFLYQNDISDNYQQNTLLIKDQLYNLLEKNETENFQQKLDNVSAFAKADLNLYLPTGALFATTQPSIFEKGFIGKIINPDALKKIKSNPELSYVLDEYIGDFHFKTVYNAINSYKTGQIMAILAVPFFESGEKSNQKITFVLTTILNIFSLIFILFMAVTFFASRYLTIPLTMLTNSLKNVSLEQQNNPLKYSGEDEIGLLVKEYNNMLLKLTESKKTLAINEKESAWREMAKLVAHEIKNPLTPIKLTLQNIQRILKHDREDKIEMIEKSTASILEQVDTLTEIANSFSAFTQMPSLKQNKFKLDEQIERIVSLYELGKNLDLSFAKSENTDFEIVTDEKLLSRIILNLIINAIESKGSKLYFKIDIKLSTLNASTFFLQIIDNGIGINPLNYDKVFQPNFSTKNTGSGIGLAICKRGIEQMGGKIGFESQLGTGTTFFVEIPKELKLL